MAGEESKGSKRFGYVVAAGVNGTLIFIAYNLVDWDWFPWLTEEFNELLPLITLSLGATVLANLAFLWIDGPRFKAMTQLVTNSISFFLALRTYQVYPLDFSAYSFNWDFLARTVLIIGIVGTGIAVIVEFVKLLRAR